MKVTLDENNSGGSWWLDRKQYDALLANGWHAPEPSPDDEKWQLLPDLEPKDIQAARQTKFLFSGDLERKIITNPFFFRREKHLLRA